MVLEISPYIFRCRGMDGLSGESGETYRRIYSMVTFNEFSFLTSSGMLICRNALGPIVFAFMFCTESFS